MPCPLTIVPVIVMRAVARPGETPSTVMPRAREAASEAYMISAQARARECASTARRVVVLRAGRSRIDDGRREAAVSQYVIHQPRLAWDGAQSLVSCCLSGSDYPWLSERVRELLGPPADEALWQSRLRLVRPERDDARSLEV